MPTLKEIIDNLKQKQDVDAVFITGSQGNEHNPYSDIDIALIVQEKPLGIKAVHTWIEGKFADIFFFDQIDLNKIETSRTLSANGLDGVFVSWLDKATVQFDKSGKTSNLIKNREDLKSKFEIADSEKDSFWNKISYNFINNKRYFNSADPLYHDALQLRLLYSVSEVISGYFEFRNMPWRGEKNAIKHFQKNDIDFYNTFISYIKSSTIEDKFKYYVNLVELVFPEGYRRKLWQEGEVHPLSNANLNSQGENDLMEYWKKITS